MVTKSKVALVLAFSLLFALGAVGVTPASSTSKKPCYKVRPIMCQGANLSNTDLPGANLKGATMPDGSIHD